MELVLTGRAKEVIIVRGANYFCYEIEEFATQVPGTVPARVAATSIRDEVIGTEVLCIFFVPAKSEGLDHLHQCGVLLHSLAQLILAVRSKVLATRACLS